MKRRHLTIYMGCLKLLIFYYSIIPTTTTTWHKKVFFSKKRRGNEEGKRPEKRFGRQKRFLCLLFHYWVWEISLFMKLYIPAWFRIVAVLSWHLEDLETPSDASQTTNNFLLGTAPLRRRRNIYSGHKPPPFLAKKKQERIQSEECGKRKKRKKERKKS